MERMMLTCKVGRAVFAVAALILFVVTANGVWSWITEGAPTSCSGESPAWEGVFALVTLVIATVACLVASWTMHDFADRT